MKILYDHQMFTRQEFGGITRYFYELISQGIKDQENEVDLSILYSNNVYLAENDKLKYAKFFSGKKFKGKVRLQLFINEFYSNKKIGQQDFDIFHPTFYDTYFLKYVKKKPFTITYYDMIHEKFVGQFPELGYDKNLLGNKSTLIHKAEKVIAISQTTKNDLIDYYGVDENKIEVIHLGSSFDSSQIDDIRIVESPYLLYVGSRDGYKNFTFCLEALASVLKEADIKLICGGGGPFTLAENELINKLGVKNKLFYLSINDRILGNLYKHAEAFIFPSLYEGFGIPVLEAFSCNCPCLLSTGGSLPEVGGDAALYFDPKDADSIRSNVNKVLNNSDARKEMIKKSEERLGQFSWSKTYRETIKFYEAML